MKTTSGYDRALELINECLATGNTTLDLGNLGLTSVPDKLGECTHLERLNLGVDFYLQTKFDAFTQSRNRGECNNLKEIPVVIKYLKNLEVLYLDENRIESISNLENLSKLRELSLTENLITKIEGLDKLVSLELLIIQKNQIERIEGLSNLVNLKGLYLNVNKISIIENLDDLLSLESLEIGGNNITIIEGIAHLINLQRLQLTLNKISTLEGLHTLTKLVELDIRENPIKVISGLKTLENLGWLHLSENKITRIEGLDQCTRLEYLDLSKNPIRKITGIDKLSRLKELRLDACDIEKIEGLSNLRHLRELYLQDNQIDKIEGLYSLINLQELSLQRNQITKLEGLGNLQKLETLSISDNKIERLSGLAGLKNLFVVELDRNEISKIENLRDLPGLHWLALDENQITQIEGIGQIPNLQHLILRENKISEINIETVKHLTHLSIRDNPIHNIPVEIIAGNNSKFLYNTLPDLLHWYNDLAQGSTPNHQIKLLVLGNGRVGKSCLVDALNGQPFDENKASSHAIQFAHWSPAVGEEQFTIWDFGGQEIYHSTHRWFMRSRAVYVVVWDRVSEDLDYIVDEDTGEVYENHTLPYWVNTIRAANPTAPILLVETQLDKYNHQPSTLTERLLPTPLRQGCQQLPFAAPDAERPRYLPALEFTLQQLARQLPDYGQPMPQSWQAVRARVMAEVTAEEAQRQRRLSFAEFTDWCAAAKVLPRSVPALRRFLHRTGVLYMNEKLLGDTLLLDQEWAIRAIYQVLERKSDFHQDTKDDRRGRFRRRQLFKEWGSAYTPKDKDLFLNFMLGCQLCFVVNNNEKDPRQTEYAIPQLMPDTPPLRVAQKWENLREEVYYLEYQYDFLHYAQMQDFIVRLGRKTQLEFIWKNGMDIPHRQSHALITADVPQRIIQIRTAGAERDYLLHALRNDFRQQVVEADF